MVKSLVSAMIFFSLSFFLLITFNLRGFFLMVRLMIESGYLVFSFVRSD